MTSLGVDRGSRDRVFLLDKIRCCFLLSNFLISLFMYVLCVCVCVYVKLGWLVKFWGDQGHHGHPYSYTSD